MKGGNQACVAGSWAEEEEEEEEGLSRSRRAGASYPEPREVQAWIVTAGNHCGLFVYVCVSLNLRPMEKRRGGCGRDWT